MDAEWRSGVGLEPPELLELPELTVFECAHVERGVSTQIMARLTPHSSKWCQESPTYKDGCFQDDSDHSLGFSLSNAASVERLLLVSGSSELEQT